MEEFISSFASELLVPLSERRHRLYKHEIPQVIAALKLYLERLVGKGENVEEAEIVFRTLFRLENDKPGRPKYPEFSWEYLEYYLIFKGKDNRGSS
jgi:hypothetical protein